MSIYFQLNQNCNNQCTTSNDKCIMAVTKGKKRRLIFFDKSGSRFWWTMIEIFILGDHKWFPIIRKNFLACLQKFIFSFLEFLPKPVTTIVMIMTDHLKTSREQSQPQSWSWRWPWHVSRFVTFFAWLQRLYLLLFHLQRLYSSMWI